VLREIIGMESCAEMHELIPGGHVAMEVTHVFEPLVWGLVTGIRDEGLHHVDRKT